MGCAHAGLIQRLCGRAGLLDLEHVSLDGSKVEANASKHQAMSYGRMEQELRERARRLRSGAETEDDPIERKRKRTLACKNEEEADRLARGDEEPESDDGDQDEDLDLPSHRVTAHAASS
jgi:hypothetical protein